MHVRRYTPEMQKAPVLKREIPKQVETMKDYGETSLLFVPFMGVWVGLATLSQHKEQD